MTADSVISRVTSEGLRPTSSSRAVSSEVSSGSRRLTGDTLMDRPASTPPSRHRRQSSNDWASITVKSGATSPVRSARGMKVSGVIAPSFGSSQRASASAEIRTPSPSTIGWNSGRNPRSSGFSSASERLLTMSSRRRTTAGSSRWWTTRPSLVSWAVAAAIVARVVSTSAPPSPWAMPTKARSRRDTPPITMGSAMCSRILLAR